METVDWNFPVTVSECVLMARTGGRLWPWRSRAEQAEVDDVLERLEIGGLARRHIRQLSGGQQQRVFVARALLSRPQLLLMDEPTSGVDFRTRHEILHLLGDLYGDGLAIVLTTHDLNGIAAHLPHLVCLNTRSSAPAHRGPCSRRTSSSAPSVRRSRSSNMPGCRSSSTRIATSVPTSSPSVGRAPDMGDLLQPYDFEFFRNGVIVATVAGGLCGLVGVFVVLKGMSYIGHGLSHAIFGGFAASALLGINFVLGAGVWGVASALLIGGVTRRRTIGADAAIGVITTASFALGLALFAIFGRRGDSFDAALFGSILGVDNLDVVAIFVVAVFVAGVVFFTYRPLLFTTFDPEVAQASGLHTARIDALLMLVLAVTILATMQVLGATLVAASIVIPATVARMLTDSFHRMLFVATALGATTGFVGMNASYHLDVQSGPAIVLVGAALFAAVFVVSGTRRCGPRRPSPTPTIWGRSVSRAHVGKFRVRA